MPSRIEKLTKKQTEEMPKYAQKWIEQGLKTGETDWETFNKYFPICYEKAGLKYPKNIVRVSSPLVGGLAAAVAEGIWKKKRDAVGDAVDDAVRGAVGDAVDGAVRDAVDGAVRGAVGDAVGDAVRDAVDDAVGDAVRDAVDDAVGDAVRDAVGGAVGDAVDDAVRGAVGGAVGDAVGDAVRDAVRGAVGGAVDGAVRGAVDGAVRGAVDGAVRGAVSTAISIAKKAGVSLSWHYWLGGQFWVGYYWWYGVAAISFLFDICKLKLSKDIMERAIAYRKVCESVNYIWPNSDFVIVCARPVAINRNAQGRLHNAKGKSIEYPDGWGLYHLNGVRFEEELYKKVTSGKMPFQEILAIRDIDQRTQAMRFGSVQDFLKHTKAEQLDTYTKYRPDKSPVHYSLHRIPKGDVFTENAFYMVYTCPSTNQEYMSGVKEFKTVPEAMAWKISRYQKVTPAQWKAMKPLVDES